MNDVQARAYNRYLIESLASAMLNEGGAGDSVDTLASAWKYSGEPIPFLEYILKHGLPESIAKSRDVFLKEIYPTTTCAFRYIKGSFDLESWCREHDYDYHTISVMKETSLAGA